MKTKIVVPDEVEVTEFHRETHFVNIFDSYETEDTDTPATLVFDSTIEKLKFLQAELEKTKDSLEQKEIFHNVILNELIAELDHTVHKISTDENGRITPLKTSELLQIPEKTRDMDFPKDGISYVENLIKTNENLSKVITGFELYFCDKQKSVGNYYESGLFQLSLTNDKAVCALHKSKEPVKFISRQELDDYINKTDLSYLAVRLYRL